MARIETGLHAHHAQMQSQPSGGSRSIPAVAPESSQGPSSDTAVQTPFARVNGIAPGSPAETAGLQVGDRVTAFGAANWMNHEKLSKVAQVVNQNEGVSCC